MALKLEDRGLVYDAASHPAEEAVAAFTALCRMRDGELVASFQYGPQKHSLTANVRLCRSGDGGKTWQELPWKFRTELGGVPGSLGTGELVEGESGEWRLFSTWFDRSDPKRPLFDAETEGILKCRQLVAVSTDRGASWSDWQVLPTPGLTGCAATGPVLQWSDGTIAYAFESFKEYDDPAPARHAAWLLVSRDGGKTFADPLLVARDPEHKLYFWDQRLCTAGPDGQYTALFWTHDREHQHDLHVHLKHGSIHDSQSTAQPVETSIPGQIAAPLWLPDGRLLAFVVDRDRPGTMTLWCSGDKGQTWPKEDRLVIYQHDERAALSQSKEGIDFAQYWEDMGKWTFGHPAIRDLGDGTLLLAFYAGTPQRLSVHWARVRT